MKAAIQELRNKFDAVEKAQAEHTTAIGRNATNIDALQRQLNDEEKAREHLQEKVVTMQMGSLDSVW